MHSLNLSEVASPADHIIVKLIPDNLDQIETQNVCISRKGAK